MTKQKRKYTKRNTKFWTKVKKQKLAELLAQNELQKDQIEDEQKQYDYTVIYNAAARKFVQQFENAVRDDEMKGAERPHLHEEIELRYVKARAALLLFIIAGDGKP
jgi:hypothetical protein